MPLVIGSKSIEKAKDVLERIVLIDCLWTQARRVNVVMDLEGG